MEQGDILWLAVNAKYSHTSLAVRYLRECVPGSSILELTINHQLLAALGEIYERQPRVLGISCYIWNIEMVKDILRLLPAALPDTIIICGGPEVSYDTAAFLEEFPMVDFVVRGEGEEAVLRLIERLRAVGFAKARAAEVSRAGSLPGIAMRREDGSIDESTAVAFVRCDGMPSVSCSAVGSGPAGSSTSVLSHSSIENSASSRYAASAPSP